MPAASRSWAPAAERVQVSRDGAVLTIDLGDTANLLTSEALAELNEVLDGVHGGAVVTTGRGASYCQGLDRDDICPEVVVGLHALLARWLTIPAYTVAAVNGHAFGGGALLVLAHDAACMRTGEGWWCLPEARIGLPFTAGLSALVTSCMTPPHALRAMLTGHRYDAHEALTAGVLTAVVPDVRTWAKQEAAAQAGLTPEFFQQTRARVHAQALMHLRATTDGSDP